MALTRILVLISGNGSNLQALIDSKIPDAQVIHVISNRKDAYGLTRAKRAGISTTYHNLLQYKKQHPDQKIENIRAIYDKDLADLVLAHTPDLVVCAGWMHILAPAFLNPIAETGIAVINLHPALPGQFNGANALQRAYEAFQKGEITKTGCMIHYVISEVDMGEPILVKDIDLRRGESLEDLEIRLHAMEHIAIVEGTKLAIERLPSRCT
ncbi:hypothetical protein MMC19_000734 [Ptychographa xylographoides]|nr:hypothetical protein [Ptychographa xylographoides]